LLSIFTIVMQRLFLIFASVHIIFYKKKRKKWHFLRIVSLFFDVTHSEYVIWLLLCIFTIVMQRLFLIFASVHIIFSKKKRKKWHFLRIGKLIFIFTMGWNIQYTWIYILSIICVTLLCFFCSQKWCSFFIL
jgi:hypothetical protein